MNLPVSRRVWLLALLALLTLNLIMIQSAQAQAPIPYGEPIKLEAALKVIAAAEVEANKNSWPVAIAVVDCGGHLVAFHRLDNTQLGSVEVALQKAKTSALFRRPTKAFEDTLAMGGASLKILSLPGALPVEGGLPIIVDGKIVGAIGVSGVKSTEDAQIAAAGLEALKPKQ
jgi:glc operon protein GlcG